MSAVKGTPTPVLLPAKRWSWNHVSGPHAIDMPFVCSVEGSGLVATAEYNIADDVDLHISLGGILKAMFAQKSYPHLEDNQMFSVSDILLDRSSETVTVIGNIIERVAF